MTVFKDRDFFWQLAALLWTTENICLPDAVPVYSNYGGKENAVGPFTCYITQSSYFWTIQPPFVTLYDFSLTRPQCCKTPSPKNDQSRN